VEPIYPLSSLLGHDSDGDNDDSQYLRSPAPSYAARGPRRRQVRSTVSIQPAPQKNGSRQCAVAVLSHQYHNVDETDEDRPSDEDTVSLCPTSLLLPMMTVEDSVDE